jgi:type I restriction enzyme S subunit
MSWRETIFDDFVRFKRGFDLPEAKLESGPFPVVASTSVTAYHKEYRVKGPGVVTGRSGSLGSVQYIREDYWPHNTALYVKDFKGNHSRFAFYFLQKMHLENFNSGAGVPTLNQNHLHKLSIRIPDFETQQKIAAILTAYDELIENSNRRIALLENGAKEIFREWFVRLRFPGHEKVKVVKGVPTGWRFAELKELAAVNPSSISGRNKPETIFYVDISSVSTNRIEEVTTYSSGDAPGRARRRVKHGDIIWSSVRPANRAYCLIYKPPENLIVSTGFAVIRPNAETPFTFLFFAVTSDPFVDQMTTVAKGAAYPATSFDDFKKAKLLVPLDELLKIFHNKTQPLFHQKHFLEQQIHRLKQTRDLLLPRLISGKLSVENLDIQFPPGMAEELSAEPTAAR